MGLNLPMLLANSQTLESWNTVGQFSPPIGERVSSTAPSSLRVPLPMSFSASATSQHELSGGSRSIFGGSSNNSESNASPLKAMETVDIEDNNNAEDKQERLQSPSSGVSERTETIGAPTTTITTAGSAQTRTDAGSSPIPNTNTNIDETIHAVSSAQMPHLAHHQNHHHTHHHHPQTHNRQQREQGDLIIKQELVDYFHAPTSMPPATSSDSHRSYSSTDEQRLGGPGGGDSDDYAQDLRVSAAAAGSAKSLDFSAFVLPRNLRPPRSPTESLEEKYTPLNMRKLNVTNVSSASAAGEMLMNSLLSNENLSQDTTTTSGRLKRSSSQDTNAAAAAALYAESLNRDDCDFVGSNVTLKLRVMNRTQRIIAEKLISEVLYYGQFNELERSARIQPK